MQSKQRSEVSEASTEPPSAAVAAPSNPPLAPADIIRVVVADDSQAIRTLARFALSAQRGFRIVGEAADGSEALELVSTHHPDCVVLDIEMPGMGGFEALAELQGRSPRLPVVLLSGHGDAATADRAVAGGAAAHLDKTSELVLLANTIRRVVTAPVDAVTPGPVEPSPTVPLHEPTEPVDGVTAELRRLEYVVSHDLGEPLRIMSGFATLLESRYGDVLDPTGQSFVKHIGEASRRMQDMLADLLTYSRAAKLTAHVADVDLASIAAALEEELADRILERGAQVSIGDLPIITGDADMLRTVIRHLIVNALTFNAAVVPKVHVAGRLDGRDAVITVTDNGIGIDPAQRAGVFDLFKRLNTREEYPGTGTGLALCRRLVTLQNGTLHLDAAPDAGTVVTLTMPAATPRAQQATPTHRRSG